MPVKTITLQIGNSDDKLTQKEWSRFVDQVRREVEIYSRTIHFFGSSPTWAQWQNVCFVFDCRENDDCEMKLRSRLTTIRKGFDQDSVAWMEGETQFL